jgi:hypothetical protein
VDAADIDRPDVVAEVRATFERYEAALVANDLDVLDELFWQDPRTQRVGIADRQHGFPAIEAARRSVAQQTPPRSLRDLVITTFGQDLATVTTEFVPDDGATPVGRQSQTWVRLPGGWRVVAAHVSWPGASRRTPPDRASASGATEHRP